ncbi:MAG TPA: ATP-binding protein [Ktedonobacterales bacterium]|nr:ATP-binding protein [Ktedonobacterales bacterium]
MANTGGAGRLNGTNVSVRLQEGARILLYLVTGGLLVLIEVVLITVFYRLLSRTNPQAAGPLTYFATAMGAIIFLPLFARIRWLTDYWLYHDTYDLSVVLQEYSQHFGSLSDQDTITSYLLDSLQRTINLAAIAYVALPEGLDASVMQVLEAGDIRARGQFATEDGASRMLAALAQLPEDANTLLRERKALRKPWFECEALILIESMSGGSIAGLLVVGTKRSGGSLQRKDRALLVTVSHLVSTAYANALLIQGLHVSLVQVQTSTNQLIAARAELQLLLRELVSAEERQRSALARELHDDALQETLYLIRHAEFCTRLAGELEVSWRGETVQAAGRRISMPPERTGGSPVVRLREELNQLADRSQVLEKKLRALCMGLYPEALRVLGLPTALEELAAQVSRTTGMTVSVYYEDETARAAEDLLPERAVHLYRIAQEALTNASKHSHATASTIYLSLLAALADGGVGGWEAALWICLTIIDNGDGMPFPLNMGALVRGGHLGLAGMRERAEQLDGLLDIRRNPSGGTRVTIMSPTVEGRPLRISEHLRTTPLISSGD